MRAYTHFLRAKTHHRLHTARLGQRGGESEASSFITLRLAAGAYIVPARAKEGLVAKLYVNTTGPVAFGVRGFTWRDGIYHYPAGDLMHPVRWFPPVHSVGMRLMGEMRDGILVLPRLKDRIALFHEMLEIVAASRQWRDILSAAVYRRQVTHRGGLPAVDVPLWRLARVVDPPFTRREWEDFGLRMPPCSRIRYACHRAARLVVGPRLLAPSRRSAKIIPFTKAA